MKPKTIILMVIAIGCGLGASYMTSQLIANRGGGNDVVVEKVKVLVAKKKIDQGLQLKEEKELFETKEVIKEHVPPGAVSNFTDVKDKYLKISLHQGGFVTKEDVSEQNVSLNIPAGFKAVGLRVTMETIAGGWASLPGNRVDIHWTYRTGSDKESGCVRLFENVQVLAADQNKSSGDGGTALPAQVVIVALKDEDVLKLNLAKEVGTMSLTLRNAGDISSSEFHHYTMDQLKKSAQGPKQDPVDEPTIKPDIPVIVKNDGLPSDFPDPSANFQEYKVKITTPEGTRTVTFLKNKTTGKWVSEVSGPEEPAGDSNLVGPLDQAISPLPDVNPTPRQEEPAPRKATKPE